MAIYGSRDVDRLLHHWASPAPRRAAGRMRPAARLAAAILFAATVFNLGLCFVNTRLFPTDARTAILAEVVIIGSAVSLLLFKRDHVVAFLIAVVCSYFSLLFIVRGAIDLKPVRDLLIPIVFVHMGQRFLAREQADRLVMWLAAITLGVSVFEFTLPDLYTRFFDALTYFINKGATRADAADFIMNGFNINGDRPTGQGRELLPFLGLHRSGSIFLEPVTAGNFGAICGAWFLQSDRPALRRWAWIALSAAIIVLADGRFGLMLLIVAIGLHFAPPLQRPLLLAFLPLAIVAFLMGYAAFVDASGIAGGNSYGGRLLYSGRVLDHLDALDWLGMQVQSIVYFDSGYAYSVTQIGLVALLAAWFGLARALETKAADFYLGAFAMVYVSLSLMVSNSMWSIKASALLWFMVGQTIQRARTRRQPLPAPAATRAPGGATEGGFR